MAKSIGSICGGLLALACGMALVAADRSHEPPSIVVNSFRIAPGGFYEAPHQAQPKSQLEGVKAQPQADGRYLVTDAKWTFFRENGDREKILTAPQCFYDSTERSVSSPGGLSVQAADGNFAVTGEGFLWRPTRAATPIPSQGQQTNWVLFISNQVHTTVHLSLIQSSTNRPPAAPAGGPQVVDIFSDRFEYETASELGVYNGDVRVSGTNLNLTAGRLTLRVPIQEARLHDVRAEQDVVVDYAQVHATGQRADYSVDAEVLQVFGQPTWRSESSEGRADTLTINRTNQTVHATGHTWLKIPSRGLSSGDFLANLNPTAASNAAPALVTNQWVEVSSDAYERQPTSAVFTGGVQVSDHVGEQVRGTLDCRTLSLAFVGTNELREMVAEQAVNIHQGDKAFQSGKAVFTATNGLLELTQNPSWRDGARFGSGDLILAQRDQMTVRGHASVRMPVGEIAASAFMPQAGKTAEVKTNSAKADLAGTNQFALVECDQYKLTSQGARFEGGVRITHPQMNWKSDLVTVDFAPTGRRAERLVAEPQVEFELTSSDGQVLHGAGEKAVYTYAATPVKTNEIVRLTGTPARMWTPLFTNENDLILLDMANFSVQMPGRYHIRGVAETGKTNQLQLPFSKRRK